MIHVSRHACQRFIERVKPCSYAEARAAILASARAIETAARFHCAIVKRGDGSRLVLEGDHVVTVYAAGDFPHQCRNPYNQGLAA